MVDEEKVREIIEEERDQLDKLADEESCEKLRKYQCQKHDYRFLVESFPGGILCPYCGGEPELLDVFTGSRI